ncbi:MAG: NAD(P)H:quinone oxidoreductase, partial [Candidatus Electrothrix sp. AUS4]|nr:NAD(P)H:quinone oxidoreductase [Candidatus Electrothrix sp. AUS4]
GTCRRPTDGSPSDLPSLKKNKGIGRKRSIGFADFFPELAEQLWMQGALIGKPGSVITSSNTQHGGQESTILSFHITLLHHGMVIVGLPYSFQGQMTTDELTGCSPYGASVIAGHDGSRLPCANELAGARFQGEHLAKIAKKLMV